MPYNTNGLNSPGNRGSQRQGAPRQRIYASGGAYHGPTGINQRSNSRGGRRRGSTGGYPLRSRNIKFGGKRGFDRRILLLVALALVVVIVLVFGVSTCMRGCSADTQPAESSQSGNQIDSRVAEGVSDEISSSFKTALDRNDKLAQIAANANQYDDTDLLTLALEEPASIDFVASYPSSDKSGKAYSDTVTKGKVPKLWCWDSRWGGVAYADHTIATKGSGPACVSMAYMAINGANDKTPTEIAALVTADSLASGDSSMSADFLTKEADSLGFSVTSLSATADNVNVAVDTGATTYALIELKANVTSSSAHWVIVTSENQDGSVGIYDPTCEDASSHDWDPATLASGATNLYKVAPKTTTTETSE